MSLQIVVNSVVIVNCGPCSGSFAVNPGDSVEITATSTAQNPLIGDIALTVIDNGTQIFNNNSQGFPTGVISYGPYTPTGDGDISASATQF